MLGFDNYDNWKTACCGNYPNCNPCPYNDEPDDEEEQESPRVVAYGFDIEVFEDSNEALNKLKEILESNGYEVLGSEIHESWDSEEYKRLYIKGGK